MAYPAKTLYPSHGLYPSKDEAAPTPPGPLPTFGSFILCDHNGMELAELEVEHTLRFEASRASSVKFALGYDQPGASELIEELSYGYIPQIRAYRYKTLILSAYWSPQQEVVEGSAEDAITCEFRSPFARLETRYLPYTVTWAGQDAGSLAFNLLIATNAQGPTGLVPGSRETSITPTDRPFEVGQQIAQLITDLVDLEGSFQFTEGMLDSRVGGALASLNIWNPATSTIYGRDLSSTIRFEYGPTTIGNVLSVQRTIAPPVNQVTVIGGTLEGSSTALFATANDTTSQAAAGLYGATASMSDIIDQNILMEKARAMLRPEFVQVVSFQPEVGTDPTPYDDYWIGDTVNFYADKDALQINTSTQITVIEIDRDGDCAEIGHHLEFGPQTVQPLVPVRRGRRVMFRDPSRAY